MLRHRLGVVRAFVVVAAAVGSLGAVPAPGGVVVVSRLSSLDASGTTSLDSFDLTDQSTELGLYDMTLGDEIDAAGGGATRAAAQQQSNLTSGPASLEGLATGSAAAQVAEFDAIAAQAASFFSLGFDVTDAPETLNLQGQLATSFDASARVTLRNGDDEVVFERIVQELTDEPLEFEQDLTLAPGSYLLIAEATANGTPSPTASSFDVQFSTSGDDGVVIPLPAPVLGGGVMLLMAAAGYGRRRLHGR